MAPTSAKFSKLPLIGNDGRCQQRLVEVLLIASKVAEFVGEVG